MKTFLKFFTYLFCLSFCLLAFSGPGSLPILGGEDRNYESKQILREILQKVQNGEITVRIKNNKIKIKKKKSKSQCSDVFDSGYPRPAGGPIEGVWI